MKYLLLSLLFIVQMFAGQFHIMTEDLPPQNYIEDGKVKGFSVEVVQTILERLGYKDEKIEVLPWARAMSALENEPNAILFSMAYTPERAKKFKLVYPMAVANSYFFTHKDNTNVVIKNVDDAKKYQQGVVKDFSQHKNLLKLGFTDFDYSPDVKTMVQKAILKRVDVISLIPFQLYSEQFSDLDVKSLRKIDVSYAQSQHSIGFNKAFSDKEIQRWQTELDKMKKSGEFDKIFRKYVKE